MCLCTHSLFCFSIGQKIPTVLPEVNKERSKMQQTAHCYYVETTARVDSPHLLTTRDLPCKTANCQQTLPHPIMHSAADYGSWFSPKMRSSFCSWVCLRSDRVLATNEPLQGLFESVPRPPLQGGLGTLVWSAFGAHPSAIASHLPKRTAPRGKTNSCDSTELNEAGVKAPLKRMHEAGIKCVCLQADTLFFLWMFCVFRYSYNKIYTN